VINEAIDTQRKIRFQYADYSTKKRKVVRHGGEFYVVSPYALIRDGDYYYAVGFRETRGRVQSFRLDRFYKTPELLDAPRIDPPKGFSMDAYAKSVFRMYDTDEPVEVTLLCENRLAHAIIDRFGKSVVIDEVDINHFTITVEACASPTFYRWVFGWNGDMKILSPEKVVEEYREMARNALL
jgi:predicted DNA-binding transcriptional regulator YafY